MTAASPTCWPMVCFVGIIDKLKDALFGPDVAEIKPAAVKVEPVQTRPTQVAPEVVAIRTVPLTARRPAVPAKASPANSAPDSENGKAREYLSAKDQPRLLVPDGTGKLPVTIKDGFFVYVRTGQLMPPANQVLAAQGVVSFRVRGTQHHHGAKSADTSPGQRAILRREPKMSSIQTPSPSTPSRHPAASPKSATPTRVWPVAWPSASTRGRSWRRGSCVATRRGSGSSVRALSSWTRCSIGRCPDGRLDSPT